ncbi:MAG TPA: peptidase S10, partial [Rudaea sp.]|nr:peptidase S10 [Rudaea sp.]
MSTRFAALVFSLLASAFVPAYAADDAPAKPAAKEGAEAAKPADDLKLPPFPADKTVHQTTTVDGKTLNYDATVGSLPVLDEKGKTIADVMFIAYTVPGANRAVTFALNGGPGAASVYLNLGAIGPKRVQFGAA